VQTLDRHPDHQVRKTFTPLHPFGKVVQRGMEKSGFPAFAGDQLDQRFGLHIFEFLRQRKGKARRHIAHAARCIDLPQPIRLSLFEFAQQQRNDFTLVQQTRFGKFAVQEIARCLERADRDKHLKTSRDRRCGHFTMGQKGTDPRQTQNRDKGLRAQWHGGKGKPHARHQHRHDRPDHADIDRAEPGPEYHDGQRPDQRQPGRSCGLDPDLMHTDAAQAVRAKLPVKQHRGNHGPDQQAQPAQPQQRAHTGPQYPHHQHRAQRMGQHPRHDQP
jgi:hypothetical protein